LTAAGLLLRSSTTTPGGFDRIDALLFTDDDDDAEVRLGPGDALFTLQERGLEPPGLEVHNRDVKSRLAPVLLALATKFPRMRRRSSKGVETWPTCCLMRLNASIVFVPRSAT
jgi:hypothetical protein